MSLLAFLQILTSHPQLVAQHRDAIIGCIDNPDASIRLRALDIIQDIVNAETLVDIVEHLMEQLRDYGSDSPADKGITARERTLAEDDEDADMASEHDKDEPLPSPKLSLALEEKLDLITRVVHMGVKDTYTHVDDFNWLISVMLEILGLAVLRVPSSIPAQDIGSQWPLVDAVRNHVASELRNVLVKVKEYRQDGVLRTEDLLLKPYGEHLVLGPLVWLIGEYSDLLIRRSQVFDILLRLSANLTNVHSLCICIHTLAKLFTHMTSAALRIWDRESTTTFSLSCARLLEYLQVLMKHAEIEVQECACQYGELFKLVSEALNDKESDKDVCPQLVALALPSLFTGLELNAVSAEAQNKIPLPEELNLDDPFSPDFSLGSVDLMMEEDGKIQEQYDFGFYHRKVAIEFPTVSKSSAPPTSRQSALGILPLSEKTRKGSPLERNVDDPFFLSSNGVPAASSADAEFDALDIESIPILDFPTDEPPLILSPDSKPASRRKLKARVASEEDLPSFAGSRVERTPVVSHEREHGKSGIELNETEEDREMRLALQEVERSRLKMQREAEKGALAEGVKPEGTVVKRKKRKKRAAPDETGVG